MPSQPRTIIKKDLSLWSKDPPTLLWPPQSWKRSWMSDLTTKSGCGDRAAGFGASERDCTAIVGSSMWHPVLTWEVRRLEFAIKHLPIQMEDVRYRCIRVHAFVFSILNWSLVTWSVWSSDQTVCKRMCVCKPEFLCVYFLSVSCVALCLWWLRWWNCSSD